MAGAVHEMRAGHTRAQVLLEILERAWTLIRSPVALAGDEHRRHVDGPAREDLQLAGVLRVGETAAGAEPVRLQAALEPGAAVFRAVDRQLGLGQPLARRDLGG